jgi:hypothetical protein
MRQLLLGAVNVAVACAVACDRPASPGKGSAAAPSTGSGSAAGGSAAGGSAADPWATRPKPTDTPASRQQRAEAALGRVATIMPVIAKLRGLSFDREVPTKYQATADFQAFVRREIAKELPAERSRALSAALAHLGFLAKPIDLATVEEQAAITQAGAYYDPAAKSFFLVMVPNNELILDTISAHELTHALQDQHFDLAHYLPSDGSLDDDAAAARRFIAEGDATFAMLLYGVHSVMGDKMSRETVAALRGQIEKLAALDVDALKVQAKAQLALFDMDADMKKALDAMDDIPPAVLVPLFESYMKGALVALTMYEHGGWASVDELYRKPPASTEQVLHPETKLLPRRDRPHRVTLTKPADPELAGNVLGELQWRVYFELWKVPHAAEAAAGWGGDRFSVTSRNDGRLIGRIATTWDTAGDATQFADAYVASLAARFPGADVSHPAAGVARADGGKVFVRTAGKRVFIVDGADEPRALDALVRTTTID